MPVPPVFEKLNVRIIIENYFRNYNAIGERLRGADEQGTVVERDGAGGHRAAADCGDGRGEGDRTAVGR